MTLEDFESASDEISSRPKKSEKKSARLNEVGGYDDIKTQLEQVPMLTLIWVPQVTVSVH